jgi:AMP-binding enzyme
MTAADSIVPAPRGREPLSVEGVVRGPDGAAYADRPRSLVAMLEAVVERRDEAVAVVESGGGEVTYAELWNRAGRVAGGLRDAGVAVGDRVAIRLPNGLDWVFAFWGIQLAGAVAVPLNIRLSEPEVEYQLADSGASYCFEPGAGLPEAEPTPAADAAPDDLAAIFYTSGTTGRPKGVMITHANFLTNSENAFRTLRVPRSVAPQISTLVFAPLFHVTGCNSQLISILEGGGRVEILPRALDLDLFLRAVTEHRINHLVTVPAIYYALINSEHFAAADVSSVRWVAYGGAPTSEKMVRQIKSADLLHCPAVAVGVGEEEEAAPGEVLDVADLDAAGEQLLAGAVDVADHELQALERAGCHLVGAAGEGDRAGGAGRGELNEAEVLGHLVVVFGDEARLLDVEGLGAVDVGDGDLDQLQAPVDRRGALGGSHAVSLRSRPRRKMALGNSLIR